MDFILNREAKSFGLQPVNVGQRSSTPSHHTKIIPKKQQLEYEALGGEHLLQPARCKVQGKALMVLLIVEPCSEKAYRLRSTGFRGPRVARF